MPYVGVRKVSFSDLQGKSNLIPLEFFFSSVAKTELRLEATQQEFLPPCRQQSVREVLRQCPAAPVGLNPPPPSSDLVTPAQPLEVFKPFTVGTEPQHDVKQRSTDSAWKHWVRDFLLRQKVSGGLKEAMEMSRNRNGWCHPVRYGGAVWLLALWMLHKGIMKTEPYELTGRSHSWLLQLWWRYWNICPFCF